MQTAQNIIVIGGSAGSYNLMIDILAALPKAISVAVCIVIHRNPKFDTKIESRLTGKLNRPVVSVIDKTSIYSNHIYFAPPGYHLLVEPNFTFSLDLSEPIHFSRPSIDVLFESCAEVYRDRCTGFLLSGANADGGVGLRTIASYGGSTFVQNPDEAPVDIMPKYAIKVLPDVKVLTSSEIIHYFCNVI